MERIRSLNRYQKLLLLCTLAIAALFTVLYPVTIFRVGFAYQDAILVPRETDGGAVYEGKIRGHGSRFMVGDRTVTFQYGPTTYGPYTVEQDPAAIPQKDELRAHMDGIEIRCGEEIVFRGGVLNLQNYRMLTNADGSPYGGEILITAGDGVMRDAAGNVVDPMEPDAYTILRLLEGPELTHKGHGFVWFFGMIGSLLTVISILFADELFRLGLSRRIRYAYDAEPSDWELSGRYITWTMMPLLNAALFIMGLTL